MPDEAPVMTTESDGEEVENQLACLAFLVSGRVPYHTLRCDPTVRCIR